MIERVKRVEGVPDLGSPFFPAIVAEGKFAFVSGQGPWDPEKQQFVCGTIEEQIELTLQCIERIVLAAGGRKENIVNVRVFLQTLNKDTFARMNSVFAKFFGDHKPTRTTVGTVLLGIDVEIDCIVKL